MRLTLPASAKVLSAADRTCSYVASDQTLDADREIVRAAGWTFERFKLNAPFVDCHNYASLAYLLGNVKAWRVEGRTLVEDVQFLPEGVSALADLAWKMTAAGFLKAVSVGFLPKRVRARWRDEKDFASACVELGLTTEVAAEANAIIWDQDQTELSACLIGVNPSAVAKAHTAGALVDEDFHKLGVDDDGLTFLHEAAAGYERADAVLRRDLRKALRGLFQVSSVSPTSPPPAGKAAQHSAARGNETSAESMQFLTHALRQLK